MKYFSVILWLLLGLLYYWIWSTNQQACCTATLGAASSEQVIPQDATNDDQSLSSMDSEDADLNDSAEEMKAKEEEEADKAIAEAEETKAVTSVGSRDDSGIQKLTFYFPYGSSESTYSSSTENNLSEVVKSAKDSGKVVVVSGHTDSSGTEGWNMTLGKRRADDVRNKLIQMGLPANQVKSQSFGEKQPIASNDTEEGRRRNRRVELILE